MQLILLLGIFVVATNAFSSGAVDLCNALSVKYGCDNFKPNEETGKPDRHMCTEENQIMDWVLRPKVKEDAFKLFVGEESNPVTTYKAGEWIQVSLRATKYGFQYRGLLMYAINAADEPEGYPNHKSGDPQKIGKWEFTDRENMFHSHCPRTVLHAAGQLKPYLTTFRFQVPEGFDGDIQFVALIKTGPANMGEFWYPNKVVLKPEAAVETSVKDMAVAKLYKGKVGQSCSEVCAEEQMVCDDSRMNEVQSVADFETKVSPFQVCKLPYLLRCDTVGLSTGESGMCFYSNKAQCQAKEVKAEETGTCDGKSDDLNVGQRLCRCKCDGQKGPCAPPPPPPPPPATTTTQATQPPQTAAPCLRDFGCDCATNAAPACVAKASCVSGKCLRKTSCIYGEAGCPCELNSNSCAQHLSCDNGVCAAKKAVDGGYDFCANKIGTAGCWCTEAGGCLTGNLQPRMNSDNKCHCVVNIDPSDTSALCVRGELGCACDRQRCNEGVCQLVGRNTVCLKDDDDFASASVLSIGLVALFAFVASIF